MSEILNTALIVRRRSEMGLSQRGLSLRLAVSARWVRAVEAGDNHQELSLRNVRDLAETLGLDLVDLLQRPEVPCEPAPDDVLIEAALVEAKRLVGREELADLFGWSLRRTRNALHDLEERLSRTGQRLHRLRGASAIRVREGVLTQRQIQRLAQTRLAKFGLTIREAALLRRVLARGTDIAWERDASVPDRIASGSLMKQGLIRRVDNRFVASDEVRYSLGLTEAPGTTAPRKRQHATQSKRK